MRRLNMFDIAAGIVLGLMFAEVGSGGAKEILILLVGSLVYQLATGLTAAALD